MHQNTYFFLWDIFSSTLQDITESFYSWWYGISDVWSIWSTQWDGGMSRPHRNTNWILSWYSQFWTMHWIKFWSGCFFLKIYFTHMSLGYFLSILNYLFLKRFDVFVRTCSSVMHNRGMCIVENNFNWKKMKNYHLMVNSNVTGVINALYNAKQLLGVF